MPPLTRQPQKVFASNANADMLAVFGSMKTGSPQYATSLSTLQSNDYLQGWQNAILDDKAPYLEEMNAVQYGLSYQIAYMLQEGIPAYDATTNYSNTSLVKTVSNNDTYVYRSLSNDNLGNALSNTTYWKQIYTSKAKTITLSGAVSGSATLDLGNTNNVSISTTFSTSIVTNILAQMYPVGALYIGTTSYCPMASFFGSWSLVSSGKALWTGNGTVSSGTTANSNYANAPANTTIAAGLPNTTGHLGYDGAVSGVFTKSTSTQKGPRTGDDGADYIVNFNLSSSNSTYGSSTTVQPPAYVVNVWRRIA